MSMFSVGGMFGSLSSGFLADRVGQNASRSASISLTLVA